MKRFPSMTRQNCLRWIFIFGVLSGLFFSSGEGIQLLPFPIGESTDSKNTTSALEKNLKSYALSVHNSSSHSALLKSKFQKHVNQYLPGGNLIFDWSNACANLGLQSRFHCQEANLSHSAIFLILQSDRAPPTV